MLKNLLIILSILSSLSLFAQSKAQYVSESARDIPLAYDVDVIIIGGTSRAVAAAQAAAKNGASVFLAAPRPYLGEDICGPYRLWLEDGEIPKSDLAKAMYSESSKVTTPMKVKYALDDALLKAKVNYLYGSYASELITDKSGEIAGVVIANRSGRQAVRGKVIIDATDHGTVARMAKAEFTKFQSGKYNFTRIVVGGEAGEKAKKLNIHYTVKDKQYAVYEYTFNLEMKDNTWQSYAKADQEARNQSWQKGQVAYSEDLYFVPQDQIKAQKSIKGDWQSVKAIDLDALKPNGINHCYVLGPCADVSRNIAAKIMRPLIGMDLGVKVGLAAAAQAKNRQLPELNDLSVQNHKAKATITAELGEMLKGIRSKKSLKASRYITSPEGSLPVIAKYDTVVVGGGTGGAPAGIASARAGARTLIIEYLHGYGGVGTLGRISKYWYGHRVGFTSEVDKGVVDLSSKTQKGWNIEAKMEWLRSEFVKAGGHSWFHSLAVGSVVKDNRFIGVIVMTPHGRGIVLANTVVDSTGNAVIPACAGLPTQEITGEHVSVQGTGLPSFSPGESYKNSDWTFTDDDDVLDMWRIHVVARKMYKSFFDQGQHIDTRARRRIVGDITISPMDIINKRSYPDTITISKSNFDNHGFSSHDIFMIIPAIDKRITLVGNVPYRALLPKGYDGLLVTGLGISAHGDAMPVLRMQPDVQNHGYAAGKAAAMAAENATTVRHIDVKALQKHLGYDQYNFHVGHAQNISGCQSLQEVPIAYQNVACQAVFLHQ